VNKPIDDTDLFFGLESEGIITVGCVTVVRKVTGTTAFACPFIFVSSRLCFGLETFVFVTPDSVILGTFESDFGNTFAVIAVLVTES
jgi:hypothetical protein